MFLQAFHVHNYFITYLLKLITLSSKVSNKAQPRLREQRRNKASIFVFFGNTEEQQEEKNGTQIEYVIINKGYAVYMILRA